MRVASRGGGQFDVEVIPLDGLPHELIEQWRARQTIDPAQQGPFHHPELVTLLARRFGECRMLVGRRDGAVAVCVPVHIPRGTRDAQAIPMCDYQSVIRLDDRPVDLQALLRGAGIRTWRFSNARTADDLARCATSLSRSQSPNVELGGSFADYVATLDRDRKPLRHLTRSLRKLGEAHGDVRFAYDCGTPADLARLLDLKRSRLKLAEPFPAAVAGVLGDLMAPTHSGGSRGALSVLTAGGRHVASCYTLEAGRRSFIWFYAFEEEFKAFSPGSLVIMTLIEALCERGYANLDLGPGGETWKGHFANASVPVYSGRIDASPLRAATQRVGHRIVSELRALKRSLGR
jgi:CelD/BcsL family acetyltransferase involved in cellulose biosynthesis